MIEGLSSRQNLPVIFPSWDDFDLDAIAIAPPPWAYSFFQGKTVPQPSRMTALRSCKVGFEVINNYSYCQERVSTRERSPVKCRAYISGAQNVHLAQEDLSGELLLLGDSNPPNTWA
ncbi:uncharacterized protein Z518_02266 [Rhinocladiella mackenziei CBS 650.93]|uniref:Uncharacterized protein n=1 Tax=Rhinocladiella mackenziei CBS 650.93 TaxID=1442369 RepID=A0A0D2HAZ5_9EURO|nr:uncharacterized protein Z518_02266 [Rhinocladiella mackenziei CBS 650.93]KIX07613.1 hypothetical protein Z518_02266 [Rhinocladiella mackenziei CBS 650.93]